MGACASVQDNTAVKIEKFLLEEHKKDIDLMKILLLGTGNAGKSTLMKQFRRLQGKLALSEQHKEAISSNITSACVNLFRVCEDTCLLKSEGVEISKLPLEFRIAGNILCCNPALLIWDDIEVFPTSKAAFQNASQSRTMLSEDELEDLKKNCRFVRITDCVELMFETPLFARLAQYPLRFDCEIPIGYYIQHYDRIKDNEYAPTHDDVMYTRQRTTGVNSFTFRARGANIMLVDVGGQKNERKKWISQFDNVTIILFLVSLPDYDLYMIEDKKTLRMHDAICVFKEIVECPYFDNTDIVLFFNKRDLFEERIKVEPLGKYFSDFKGPEYDYDAGLNYIKSLFVDVFKNRQQAAVSSAEPTNDRKNVSSKVETNFKTLTIFDTVTTDVDNVRKVFDSLQDMIRKLNLQAARLV